MIIAGIGSRETPTDVLQEMEDLARWITIQGGWIRSGHSDGADYAFERGAKERAIVYLPWRSYNTKCPLLTPHVRILDESSARQESYQSVEQHHPAHTNLKVTVRKLHARNYLIIAGESNQADAVVFWARESKTGHVNGGTGQSVRIARSLNIQCFNLQHLSPAQIKQNLSQLYQLDDTQTHGTRHVDN